MSKNVFINNLDTYVSRAIFKELRNDEPDENGEPNPDAHRIFGTYLTKDSSSAPDGIKKMLKVSPPLLTTLYLSSSHCLKQPLRDPRFEFSFPPMQSFDFIFCLTCVAFETQLSDDVHL